MRSAYNELWLHNLTIVRETKRWYKQSIITSTQFESIQTEYKSFLYSPNFIIKVLLFIASLLAISGITGLLALGIEDVSEKGIAMGSIIYGLVSFFVLEAVFIKSNHHYRSGVTEAILYHAMVFVLGGIIYLVDGNVTLSLVVCLIVFVLVTIRYLDLLSTIAALLVFAGLLFYVLYEMDGIFRQVIPFTFIIVFIPVYWLAKRLKENKRFQLWRSNLLLVESISLLLIYFGGNYLVVRELSVELMDLQIEEGQDIPFAMIFYGLTIIIPAAYLYFGIRNKDAVLIRISLLLVALSAFTFKYYFSFGHPEITLTIAGTIVLMITLSLMNYLKIMRHGYTRENLLAEKWGDMNLEAFIISQTVGGNQVNVPDQSGGGGGHFGGGGSSDSF